MELLCERSVRSGTGVLGVHQGALEYFLKELLDFVLCTHGYSCGWGTDFSPCHGMCKMSKRGEKYLATSFR